MFKNAKVGDRVWDFLYQYGTIEKLKENTILVKFDSGINVTYNLNGSSGYPVNIQTLFWNRIEFEIPEKSFDLEAELRKLEIQEFCYRGKNFYLLWDNQTQEIFMPSVDIFEKPLCIYFNEKSAMNFYEKIKDKKITKEQFFRAYKNVFGDKK